ncbi:SPFH domain-containing protein [Nocardioides acrostichi]|uniref:SPFH domain-containing protein n=1 Tax=Nocardioides acrostichi TaxID=2784339 RepID=A0A930Y7V5_9ACTN|nr:SPFH domain-containing protein [Nocardioides acrostichi]MBF4163835.1 SPFH domain-containing protein [Nocardioides acrostichi]
MADIKRYPFVRHLRADETTHVRLVRNGTVLRATTGGSFWFRPLSSALSELPVDDQEVPLVVHGRTSDFQDLAAQLTVTFRFSEPALAAGRIDFGIDPVSGRWRGAPMAQVQTLLSEAAQQHVIEAVAGLELVAALTAGVPVVREAVREGLVGDARLVGTGLEVVDVRVVALTPEPDVEKALRTTTREQLQQEADRATYERRAVAVERERAIAENELANQIELARREEQLVAQRGANERRRAQEAAAADEVAVRAEVARTRETQRAAAEGIAATGVARAEAESARVAAYRDAEPGVLMALALQELAGQLPEVGTLVLSPDVVTTALARLGASTEVRSQR